MKGSIAVTKNIHVAHRVSNRWDIREQAQKLQLSMLDLVVPMDCVAYFAVLGIKYKITLILSAHLQPNSQKSFELR